MSPNIIKLQHAMISNTKDWKLLYIFVTEIAS